MCIDHVPRRRSAPRKPPRAWRAAPLLLAALAAVVLGTSPARASEDICRVTTAGSTSNNGASWSAPMDLQSALTASVCTEIWVAAGVYWPTTVIDADASFTLQPDQALYGGFAGNETSRGQRDPQANLTILSGDIGHDDAHAGGTEIDLRPQDHEGVNSLHVVTVVAGPASTQALVDGFTITSGGSTPTSADGGGLLCRVTAAGETCSPTLSQLVFSGNVADHGGGVALISGQLDSSPHVSDCRFTGNFAYTAGGAIYSDGGTASMQIAVTDSTFDGNASAGDGGALASVNGFAHFLANVTFRSNNATDNGGAVYSASFGDGGVLMLRNATLVNNSIANGLGGSLYSDGATTLYLKNSIVWRTSSGGGPVPITGGTVSIDHAVIRGGCPAGVSCTAVGSADPMLGPLQDNGGSTPTMLPGSGSSALDSGLDSDCASTDQRGVLRPQGLHCDLGAVERVPLRTAGVCRVDTGAGGANNGSSWADAYTDLQSALHDFSCTEVWVAAGVYHPVVTANPASITAAEAAMSFQVRPGQRVYGGFAGNEATREGRDPANHVTVLSGDIGLDDSVNADGITWTVHDQVGTNSEHVVLLLAAPTAGPIGADTVLDGFSITAGDADGGHGGGLYCRAGGAGHGCSPRLQTLRFIGNRATAGGGVALEGIDGAVSTATLIGVHFVNNWGILMGGALYNDAANGLSRPTLRDVVFATNVSVDGGAIYNNGEPNGVAGMNIIGAYFGNNDATTGAVMYNNGKGGSSSPSIRNATVTSNDGTYSIVFNDGSNGGDASPVFTNVTFSDNRLSGSGAVIDNDASGGHSQPALHNVILWDPYFDEVGDLDAATIDHSIVYGGCPLSATCTDVTSSDPMLSLAQYNGGPTRNQMPQPGSPAIDAGNDATCPATDQRSVLRLFSPPCDIGAVEAGTLAGLTISDGRAYARYGQVLDYVVTLHNHTAAPLQGVAVSSNLPAKFAPGTMSWICTGGSGTRCTAAGTGALNDATVSVPALGNVAWVVTGAVAQHAAEAGGITLTGSASTGAMASDNDSLVLFRDGFDAATTPMLTATRSSAETTGLCSQTGVPVALLARRPASLIQTLYRDARGARAAVAVQRLGSHWVRLLLTAPDRAQTASRWHALRTPRVYLQATAADLALSHHGHTLAWLPAPFNPCR